MDNLLFDNVSFYEEKRMKEQTQLLMNVLFVMITFILLLDVGFISADNSRGGVNDILEYTRNNTLTGRNTFIAKYLRFLITIVQVILSTCGFIMICLKISTFAVNCTFLVAPPFWIKVHKSRMKYVQKRMAMNQGQSNSEGFQRVGDILSWIASYIIPDFYGWSEWCTDSGVSQQNGGFGGGGFGGFQGNNANLTEGNYPDLLEYLKDNFGMTILTLFCAGILFSGKLLELGGNCADGLTTIIDRALDINVRGKVDTLMDNNKQYKFNYATNKVTSRNRKAIATKMYSQVKTAVSDNQTTEFYALIGSKIEEIVNQQFKDDVHLCGDGVGLDYVTVKNPTLNCNVEWNINAEKAKAGIKTPSAASESGNGSDVWIIPFSEIIDTSAYQGEVTPMMNEYKQTAVIIISFTANQVYDEDLNYEPGTSSTTEEKDKGQ